MTERPTSKDQDTFPAEITLMIPTAIATPPQNSSDWLCEVKWDGVRAIVFIKDEDNIKISSRNGNDITNSFPELERSFRLLGRNHTVVLDGEIVCKEGKSSEDRTIAINRARFGKLRARKEAQNNPAIFIPFDILFLNGQDLRPLTLDERKELLKKILPESSSQLGINTNIFIRRNYQKLLTTAKDGGYEGVVFKKRSSLYIPGRSKNWLKLKFR